MPGISGLIAAAFTPRGKSGEVDFGAFFELLDFLTRARLAGIALFTAAGEYPAVDLDERSRLTYLAVKRSRIPVLAGVGAATLDHSVSLARDARDAGAAALLLPPPYFFPLDQSDLREFYLQFAHRAGPGAITLIVNTPPLTPRLEPETLRDLMATGEFAGIVDVDPTVAASTSALCLSASDAAFAAARRSGAAGAISELACIAPEFLLALDHALCSGSVDLAESLERELQTAAAWLAEFPQPAALKAAANLRKLKTGAETASPLTPAKQARMLAFCGWFSNWVAEIQKLAVHA